MLGRIFTAARPRSIVATPDGRTLFVTCENAASISVVDVGAGESRGAIQLTMPDITATPPRPMGAVLSPDGSTVFVTNGRAQSVVGDRRGDAAAGAHDSTRRRATVGYRHQP